MAIATAGRITVEVDFNSRSASAHSAAVDALYDTLTAAVGSLDVDVTRCDIFSGKVDKVVEPETEDGEVAAAPEPAKRGPGRPKGSKNRPATNADGTPRRGPGRPKGSKNKPKDTDTATAETPRRGPGRPKGSKNKPKATATVAARPKGRRVPARRR